MRLLARLVDDRGVIQIPGIYDDVAEPSAEARGQLACLPFDERAFRRDAGLVASRRVARDDDDGGTGERRSAPQRPN